MKRPSSLRCFSQSEMLFLNLVLSLSGSGISLAQSCVPALMESQAASASYNKFGFGNACPSVTLPKMYLSQTESKDYSYSNSTSCSYFRITHVETYDKSQAFLQTNGDWTAPVLESWPSGEASHSGCTVTATLDANGNWSDGGACANVAYGGNGGFADYERAGIMTPTECTSLRFAEEYHQDSGGIHWDMTHSRINSSEYTDEILHDDVMAHLPAYSAWAVGNGHAYSEIDANHIRGTLRKVRYRFKLPETEADTTYRLQWNEITTYPDNTTEVNSLSEEIEGTGDPNAPVTGLEHEMLPPFYSGQSGGTITMRTANVTVSIVPKNSPPGSPPGAGPGPGAAGPGGCASCLRGPSESAAELPSPQFSLGQGLFGQSAGSLAIHLTQPGPSLAQPAGLTCTANNVPGVQIALLNGEITQVQTPQAVASVGKIDACKYTIAFRYPGAPTSFVTWTIENPDASGNTFNQLRLTETRGAESKTHIYVYTAATKTWKFTPHGNLVEQEVTTSVDPGDNLSQVVSAIRSSGGADVFKIKRKYKTYNWGEVLAEETLSPGSNPKETRFAYYDMPAFTPNGTFIPLRQVVNPDGGWEYYSYDSSGRRIAVYSGFGNLAASDPPAEPVLSQCRATKYYYGATCVSGSGDSGTLRTFSPRMTESYVQGNLVSRSYLVVLANEVREIRCQRANANWNDTDNLVTTTTYYSSGPNLRRIQSVENPDGTMSLYTYADNGSFQTTTVCAGKPNPQKTAIYEGTQTVITTGDPSAAQPNVHQMKRVEVKHITGGVAGAVLSRDTYSDYDEFQRPRRVTHLDTTYETTVYNCCGLESTSDRDGVVTTYASDAAGRLVSETRLGITTTKVLDAAGNVKQTTRTGTDNTTLTMSQASYNLAGQATSEINALNGPTSYAETYDGNGQKIRTITYPDNGTRIETYFRDGTLATITGTAVFPVRYESGYETDGPYTKEIRLASDTYQDTGEWIKTYTDAVGRTYKTVYPDNACRQSWFNSKGQLWKERDPDGVITFYAYNLKGEREYTVQALSTTTQGYDYATLSSQLSESTFLGGADRISRVLRTVVPAGGGWPDLVRTDNIVWKGGQSVGSVVSRSEVAVDGTEGWQTVWREAGNDATKAVTHTLTPIPDRVNRTRTVTVVAPDGTQTASLYQDGRLASVTRNDNTANHNPVTTTTYGYTDPHGRQNTVTVRPNATSTYTFNQADLIETVTTPDPGTGSQVTTTHYDNMGRVTDTVEPDNTTTTRRYFLTGLLRRTFGSRIYPVEYTYDYAGRMKTMTNWSTFNAGTETGTGARVTTWNYHAQRAWLQNKRYPKAADGTPSTLGADYTYTPGGRLRTRTWARKGTDNQPLVTTYTYGFDDLAHQKLHADLMKIEYSANDPAGTPWVTYDYDRLGRRSQAVRNGITTSLDYNDADQPLSETYNGGILNGFSVSAPYKSNLQRDSLSVGGISGYNLAYSYDTAGRLYAVSHGSSVSTYSYVPNSLLVQQIVSVQSGVGLTTTRAYDVLNRLQSISSVASGSAAVPMPISYGYHYNNANQRDTVTLADNSYWSYGYDGLGQVTSGKHKWQDNTFVAGQQFEYLFDDIGNRSSTKTGGDSSGGSLRPAQYSPDLLNRYSQREVPGAVDVLGLSVPSSPVTVNGVTASRKGEYFHYALPVGNSGAAQYPTITVNSGGQSSSGNVFVPKTAENFGCDDDGNLTSDGRWN